MRLEPSDKPMYHRMDQRDRALIMIPVFGIAASLGLFFSCGPFSGHHRWTIHRTWCVWYVWKRNSLLEAKAVDYAIKRMLLRNSDQLFCCKATLEEGTLRAMQNLF